MEMQICGEFANLLNCELVAEAANGPIDTDADRILYDRNITVIPDILANSGGVVVSYYEWLQNKHHEYLEEDVINKKLETRMALTFDRVLRTAQQKQIPMRDAAYYLALNKIYQIYKIKHSF